MNDYHCHHNPVGTGCQQPLRAQVPSALDPLSLYPPTTGWWQHGACYLPQHGGEEATCMLLLSLPASHSSASSQSPNTLDSLPLTTRLLHTEGLVQGHGLTTGRPGVKADLYKPQPSSWPCPSFSGPSFRMDVNSRPQQQRGLDLPLPFTRTQGASLYLSEPSVAMYRRGEPLIICGCELKHDSYAGHPAWFR